MHANGPSYGTAREINPDGGTHAISTDPAERHAAEEATRHSWRRFPYYARRYGERGHRFSLSDSGWITTLCALSPVAAERQILWLADLLAARGMPRYLLECHLGFLHTELARNATNTGHDYRIVSHCAAFLAARREQHLPLHSHERLAAQFETATAAEPGAVRDMGSVLVAAVIDERDGLTHAVDRVTEWACDPARFRAQWIAAVHATLSAAREEVSRQ